MPDGPEDPHKFVKLIEMDLERRRRELPTANRRSIFTWRLLAIFFLVGAAFLAWWMLDIANQVQDQREHQKAPGTEEVREPDGGVSP